MHLMEELEEEELEEMYEKEMRSMRRSIDCDVIQYSSAYAWIAMEKGTI